MVTSTIWKLDDIFSVRFQVGCDTGCLYWNSYLEHIPWMCAKENMSFAQCYTTMSQPTWNLAESRLKISFHGYQNMGKGKGQS